jgi:hypothetical protein
MAEHHSPKTKSKSVDAKDAEKGKKGRKGNLTKIFLREDGTLLR